LVEEVVSGEELQILLNLIEDEISVMYPFYKHFCLLTAEREGDGYRLRVLQGEVDFDEQRSRFDFADEMPGYGDFV